MKKILLFSLFMLLLQQLPCQTNNDIYLLIRGDDIGSCHSSNLACIESYRNGIMRSVEIMAPCPWFPEAIKLLQENPGLDVGVHLTITSEWSSIKWRPLTCCPSLVDKDGYFFPMIWPGKNFPKETALHEAHWNISEIEQEFRAQIEMVKRYIPRVSHLGCHMGCESCAPEIATLEKKLAKEYNLDINLESLDYRYAPLWNSADTTPEQRVNSAVRTLKNLKPGKYYFIDHPGLISSEMEALGHKGYENVASDRDAVTKVFTSKKVRELIDARDIHLVSYKDAADHKQFTSISSEKKNKNYSIKPVKEYTRYQDIYDLIRNEIYSVRVTGKNVYSNKTNSFSLSQQVLYDVDDVITSDISYITPVEVKSIEYLDGPSAAAYGVRGANGIIKITLRK
jgi:predicted glycoside hydrolase/deacetylase ChbG (UPF0249 family)